MSETNASGSASMSQAENASTVTAPSTQAPQQIFTSKVPIPPKLDLRGVLAKNWKNWIQTWKAYETITGLTSKPNDYQVATFITCIGPEAIKIHSGLPFASEEDKGRIDKVLELWNNCCVGKTNTIYECYKFNNRVQEPGETIDAFASAVRKLAELCSFGALKEEMIRDRLVCGILDNGLRKKLLQEADLTLEKYMNYCKAAEAANSQLKEISSHGAEAVHQVSKPDRRTHPPKKNNKHTREFRNCKYCGKTHERKMEKCPAYGKICEKCSKRNHFSSVCQQKITPPRKTAPRSNIQKSNPKVHELQEDPHSLSEDELWALSFTEQVNAVSTNKNRIYAAMEIGNKMVDTGASCNVLPRSHLPATVEIKRTKRELVTYSKSKLSGWVLQQSLCETQGTIWNTL